MEVQLNELIEKIKKDGVSAAQAEAANVKAGAEDEAKKIIEAAKREAHAIVTRAKEDALGIEKAGVAAIEQAGRDLMLAFKSEIQKMLNNITAKMVADAYSAELIKGVLPDLIKNWAHKEQEEYQGNQGQQDQTETGSLTVLLAEKDLEKLEEAFITALGEALKGGVEVKAVKKIDSGFRILEKDGSAFYDFSAESVAAMLSAYLNPRLSEIMKNI
jgi:V/A-type H+-transporting ATPase subunit E